jgi:hypothetical protein
MTVALAPVHVRAPHARVEHRQVQVGGAALAGRHAADHLRAIGDGLFGMERALRAGEALTDHLGIFVDENGHALILSPL